MSAMNKPGIRTAWILALLVTFAGCSDSESPVDPGPLVSIMISGHPEWPPIMYRSGAVIDGAGPALVKKIFDDLQLRTAFPYSGTWDDVQAKARILYFEPFTTTIDPRPALTQKTTRSRLPFSRRRCSSARSMSRSSMRAATVDPMREPTANKSEKSTRSRSSAGVTASASAATSFA